MPSSALDCEGARLRARARAAADTVVGRVRGAPAGGITDGAVAALRATAGSAPDAVIAGLVAAVTSGAPSTVTALVRGDDLLEGARAAGAIALPWETRTVPLLGAAVPVHLALSVGWAAVLDRALPRGREIAGGVAGGLLIAALDLGVIGRRLPAIRTLPQPRQWADHVAYGLTVGAVLARLRWP